MHQVPHPAEALVLSKIPTAIQERAKLIRLVAFDVDGILTDGSLFYNAEGEQLKCFNALDGYGLKMLEQSGIKVALITGRSGPIIARRAGELGISLLYQDARKKEKIIAEIINKFSISPDQVAYMGDDIIDLAPMQKVGLAVSVPNAPIYIQHAAHWVSNHLGGKGAARELSDLILSAQGLLSSFLQSNAFVKGVAIQ